MEQYISKSALVAEIERRIKTNKECMLGLRNLDYYQGKVDALNDTISFIDTLEVKEVNLEKEVIDWWDTHYSNKGYTFEKYYGHYLENSTIINIAKHFFELGLRYKSSYVGMPNIDDTLKEMGVDSNSKIVKIFKESYCMALEKFKEKKGI